jgi:ribosome-binding protein aMBF1 (putative translation factor)
MSKPNPDITSLDAFKDEHFGKRGSPRREAYEAGYESFKIGAMIQAARHERGLTQQELATKVGMTKSYISRIENNLKEVRLSTLQRIVELGFGGQIDISIKF